jgi:hypothetical protein
MTRAHAITVAPMIVALALLAAAACGGKSSGDGSGGTTNTGGTGGTGAGGGCGQGLACSTPGATCTPDECCPCTYSCQAGTWTASMCPGCAAPQCPATPPMPNAPCSKCDEQLQPCVYEGGCISASCVGKQWQLEVTQCPPKKPCGFEPGSQPCPPGALCVYPGGLGDPPYCAPNPCPPEQAPSCDCAGKLCTYGYCSSASFDGVWCECPNC